MSTPEMPQNGPWSYDFQHVLREELNHVGESDNDAGADPIARAHRKQLVGLAFSGGGVRSATFNLGVLQALAQMKLLLRFDYLSTVSGGGYIGSWLMAWIKRRGLKDVQQSLCPEWVKQAGHSEPPEIHFLRRFSNYLTPKLGWLGADMWTVIATYLRNMILNLIVLIAAMTCLLLMPRVLAIGAREAWRHGTYLGWTLAAIAAVFAALIMITRSLRSFRRRVSDQRLPNMSRDEYENLEALSLLEKNQLPRWKDAAGAAIAESVNVAALKSNIWYDRDYGDFILRAEFSLRPDGRTDLCVWQKRADGAVTGGHAIKIRGGELGIISTPVGCINETPPVRPATLLPAGNILEITCHGEHITVRINGETINKLRVAREERGRQGRRKWKPGVLGLQQTAGVEFENLRVRELASALDAGGTQEQIQWRIVLPLFLAAFLATFLFHFGDVTSESVAAQSGSNPPTGLPMRAAINPNAVPIVPWSLGECALATGSIAAGLLLLARLLMRAFELGAARWRGGKLPMKWTAFLGSMLSETVCLGIASLLGGLGVRGLYEIFKERTLWEVTAWGTPAIIGLSMLTLTVHIGLLGRAMPDQVREWWSRLGAWLLIYTLCWASVCSVAFYVSPLFGYVNSLALSTGWVISTAWGVFAARSASTGNGQDNRIRNLVAQVAPYIFVLGLFLFLSWGIDLLVSLIATGKATFLTASKTDLAQLLGLNWSIMDNSNTWLAVGVILGAAIFVALIFSWRLDINQFSMHLLYRNRLGRCYLGASNRFRRAQPFTGFAADDDFNLWELHDDLIDKDKRMTAPYLIINAALNLVGGKELAWQQRKAASFVFTQKYCGYEFPELPPGYSPTVEYAASPSPVSLATAMAISGAAASPNMGYHTSPASAFLMTVFNVRLGWWLGNTRKETTWTKSSPGNVLLSLLRELFGLTSDEGKFVYLSDGGHFENLGIYELVRRRCRFVVACDAEEDRSFGFGGLGNAIEKCRADLGIDVAIDVEPIRRRSEEGHSEWHCAIGKIGYSQVDPDARDGILIYLKSSLTGDEPTDVLRYAAENCEFPHQSTGDQWFDESQFESYRALGFHMTQSVFGAVDAIEKLSTRTKEQLFVELAQRWYPPSAATKESFTKHTRAVVAIYDELRKNRHLTFLSEQIYPEWRVLFNSTPGFLARWRESLRSGAPKSLRERLPQTPAERQAGFYICNSMFRLMEEVYLDLDLEKELNHPDNRGWMNFFKHWSWAPMSRVVWTMSASTYGARFQSFCERHLNLTIGRAKVEEIEPGRGALDSEWPPETARLSRALADTVWRWLIRKLPLDPAALGRATAEAARFPSVRGECSEQKALEIAREAIVSALKTKEKEDTIPQPDRAADEDAEWLAAATLLAMIRRGVDESERARSENDVAGFALFHGASIARRFLIPEMRERFNVTERELIELFFIYNPKLVQSGRIFRFYLSPDCGVVACGPGGEKNDDLDFPFGFAISATIKGCSKLVYFRIQDHLRRMGLARQALEELIRTEKEKGEEMGVELYEMHPDAHEVPTNEDCRRFLTLFDSAKTAVQQKGILAST